MLGWPDAAAGMPYQPSSGAACRPVVAPVAGLAALAALDARVALTLTDLVRSTASTPWPSSRRGTLGRLSVADVHVRVLCDPRTGIVEDPGHRLGGRADLRPLGLLARRRSRPNTRSSSRAWRWAARHGLSPSRLRRCRRPAAARVSGRVVGIAEGWFELPDLKPRFSAGSLFCARLPQTVRRRSRHEVLSRAPADVH